MRAYYIIIYNVIIYNNIIKYILYSTIIAGSFDSTESTITSIINYSLQDRALQSTPDDSESNNNRNEE